MPILSWFVVIFALQCLNEPVSVPVLVRVFSALVMEPNREWNLGAGRSELAELFERKARERYKEVPRQAVASLTALMASDWKRLCCT